MIPLTIADENIQFPVLRKYEQRMLFDLCSFVVPVRTISGELVINEADLIYQEMVPRFTAVDRDANYRQAWTHFEQRLSKHRSRTSQGE